MDPAEEEEVLSQRLENEGEYPDLGEGEYILEDGMKHNILLLNKTQRAKIISKSYKDQFTVRS